MKIRFESDDDLPLGEALNIPSMTIIIASVFKEDGKYYPQVCLHECSEKGIYTSQRSELNGKCSKQASLFMIVDGENRHYTAIKNSSRLLKSFNANQKGANQFCLNCLNDS